MGFEPLPNLEERNNVHRSAMIRSLLLTIAALGAALPAGAQTPRIEVSGGYQFFNISADLEGLDVDTGDLPVRNVDQSLPAGWYSRYCREPESAFRCRVRRGRQLQVGE